MKNEDKREFMGILSGVSVGEGFPLPKIRTIFSFVNSHKNNSNIDLIVCNFCVFQREGKPLPYEN